MMAISGSRQENQSTWILFLPVVKTKIFPMPNRHSDEFKWVSQQLTAQPFCQYFTELKEHPWRKRFMLMGWICGKALFVRGFITWCFPVFQQCFMKTSQLRSKYCGTCSPFEQNLPRRSLSAKFCSRIGQHWLQWTRCQFPCRTTDGSCQHCCGRCRTLFGNVNKALHLSCGLGSVSTHHKGNSHWLPLCPRWLNSGAPDTQIYQ